MDGESQEDTCVVWDKQHDVLTSLVSIVGLRGLVLSTMELGAPWRIRNTRATDPVLHVVTSGLGFVSTAEAVSPIELGPGDAVMLLSGSHYEVVDQYPSRAQEDIVVPSQGDGTRCSARVGGLGPRTELTCCVYRFHSASAAPLLHLLPSAIVVRADHDNSTVRVLLEELVRESKKNQSGSEGVMSRLAELVFLLMLRSHLETVKAGDRGLLAAVVDPRVGRALRHIHKNLSAPWTVASLAAAVGMSRAGFSELFTEKTGDSPIKYIHRCRIHEAMRLLRNSKLGLSEIGKSVGYSDAAAFSRAFRRDVGTAPRDYRDNPEIR